MRWTKTMRLRAKSLLRRRAVENELDDELRAHLDHTIAERVASGMTPEEARRQALLEIGGMEQVKEECRDARGWRLVADIGHDVSYGARMLRHSPGFAVVAVLTLALGIGANISMLGVVDALLVSMPAHIRAPEQLVYAGQVWKQESTVAPVLIYGQYQWLSSHCRFAELAAEESGVESSFGKGADSRRISAEYVSPNYFHVLGASMLLGRAFDAAEDQPRGSEPVVVLGYDLWQSALGGDPKVLGRTVWIGGEARTVVGVAPKGFTGAGFLGVDAWLPPHAFEGFPGFPSTSQQPPVGQLFLTVVGRLRKGVTVQQAAAELATTFPRDFVEPGSLVRVEPVFASRWKMLSSSARVSLWIAGVSLVVLLIACVNVSSLLLARMAQRRHEMAIRQHLGATRGRLMRQVLIEGLLLGAAGGAAALLVALLAQPLVRAFLLPEGFYESSFLSGRLLALAVALAALAGCASGLAPAWRASGPKLAKTLKQGERGHTREGSGLRWALVVTQIGLALLLAVGAGLFIRSLRNADTLDLGIDPNHLLQATVDLPSQEFSPAEISAAYARLSGRAKQVPGVADVALANMLTVRTEFTFTERSDSGKTLLRWTAMPRAVTPGYFAAMGMRILAGRPLLDSDTEATAPVAVVSESLARAIWPGQRPIGKCMTTGITPVCARVVGVVPDAWPTVSPGGQGRGAPAQFYIPVGQAKARGTIVPSPDGLLIRTRGETPALTRNLFAALESVSPGGRYVSIVPYTQMLDSQTRSWRLGASMFGLFGGLALVLAAIGIYGVLAFLVRQRTAEIGVRMALGATPRDVLRMVVGEGMKFAALGIALGAGAALALTRLLKSLLYGVTATDPWTFAAAAVVLALVALAACALAAWRAMRIDPNVALRHE